MGFSDADIGSLSGILPADVRRLRTQWGIVPVYKMVDTCAAEFEAVTPSFYSTYEQENEAAADRRPKDRHPRLRADPDRPGDRVRLLLRAERDRPAGAREQLDHGEQQP